jgi:3-oxoacyl-[acyl-carrier-protein] synthase II
VTGLGLVTPLGPGVEETWGRLVRGERAIRPITLFDTHGQRAAVAGEVGTVDLPAGPPDVAGAWSRTSGMALAAAGEAMRMARLRGSAQVGLVIGSTTGGMFETERLLATLHAEPECRRTLVSMLSHPLTATGDRLDECLGPFARVRTLSSACSSGANAIVVAAAWLLSGEVDAVVAGGSDGLCRLTLGGFNAIAALDPEPCRPFDRRRHGTNLGEGAGFLVIERPETAQSRGALPVAELAGWAVGSEAYHITHPAPDGTVVASLIEQALDRAAMRSRDVDYVNAHGTGTLANDRMEAAALRRVLGDEVRRVPVSSSKAQIGHTLGAAGAIEAVITALVVARRTLVPTAGLDDPDESLGLLHVPHLGREVQRVRAAVSNSFGFGGMDTVLVFTPPERTVRGLSRSAARGAVAPASRAVITGVSVFGPRGALASEACGVAAERVVSTGGSVDPDPLLDPARSRRLDLASRLAAVVVERALEESGVPRREVGVVLGSAFGSIDGCAAFMHRIFEKGPRMASPAEFPSLVPSASVGHVSIYGDLHGPAFGTSDLAASGESAVVQASQLIAVGEATCIVAGSAEPRSSIAERVLSALFDDGLARAGRARVDLAAAVVLEAEAVAIARCAHVLARIERVLEWRVEGLAALAGLRVPRSARAEVVLARASEAGDSVIAQTSWRDCPRVVCADLLGESDALGAVAVAIAAARIGAGRTSEALVLGVAQRRGYAILLAGP